MKTKALVSLLWPDSGSSVLLNYFSANRDTVLVTLRAYLPDATRSELEARGIGIVLLEEILDQPEREQLQRWAEQKSQDVVAELRQDGAYQHLAPWLRGAGERQFADQVLVIEALDRVANRHAVKLVVVNEDVMSTAKTAVLWARARQIPSLHLYHGFQLALHFTVHSRLYADHIAVEGERGRQLCLDSGFAAERIHVTGFPLADNLVRLKPLRAKIRRELYAQYRFDPALPLVVFGSTWASRITATIDPDIAIWSARAYFAAMKLITGRANLLFKDRPSNVDGGAARIAALAAEFGLSEGDYGYQVYDPHPLIIAADIVVSVNSGLSVECMVAGTLAVNLMHPVGLYYGPSFEADSGVVESEADNLGETILRLLTEKTWADQQREKLCRAAEFHNAALAGNATKRVADLMRRVELASPAALPPPPALPVPRAQYVWEQLLEVSDTDATQYHNWPRSELVDLAPRPLRKVLDIGCAAGKTGEYIKQKFPQAKVHGVEVNRTAATLAEKRLDSVFAGKFEDYDFAAHGIEPGSLDTVIVADVLEHIYDPWGVLVRLKPYLTPDAQILASIPNTRNLALMNGLAEGDWRYEAWGLLDVTHIRFFTLKEIRRFFHETGYRVTSVHNNLDSRLADMYQGHRDKPMINIDFERFTLKNVSQEELAELCTIQFFVVAEPGAVDDEAFATQEKTRATAQGGRTAYELWRSARVLTKVQGDLYEQRMAAWPAQPVFHLALVANPFDENRLGRSIQSLAGQYYHKLHLTVVSPAAPPTNWADSERLAWRQASEDGLIEAANRALLEGGADWVGMVDAGDVVEAHSFLFIAEAINAHPDWGFIYTDEDEMTPEGKFEQPRFKPDFNLDLLRSTHYTGGLALLSRALFGRLNGLAASMRGAEDYDLVLRACNEVGARGIGHLPDVLYHRLKNGGRWRLPAGEQAEVGKLAVASHLSGAGIHATVEHGLLPASYRVRYQHDHKPRVSILVAVRDQIDAVQRCIESVLGNTRYPDYEILLVDNDSTHPESRAFLTGLEAMGDERIRVYSHPVAANLTQLHNLLAREAKGDYLLFLYFDAAIVQDGWLDGLMAHGLRPDVGLVAPRLLRSNGTVEQTGLVLGLNKAADTLFHGEAMDHAGYMGRAHLEQDFSALGGGCLLVRTTVFAELGGFDAEDFAAAYAEADFCRRAIDRGWLAVWTPFVNVLCAGRAAHHAWRNTPIEEGALKSERSAATEHLYQRYLPQLARDPAYNVNLSLSAGAYFSVEACSSLTWDPLPWRPLPRILAQPADDMGCGEYRVISPMRALVNAGRVQGWTDFHIFTVPEMARLDMDAIILQRQTLPEQIEAIARHKKFNRAFKVYELDDLIIKLPMKSIHKTHMPKDVTRKLRQAVALCDRFVVSTEPLKEAYRDYHSDIRVVPNCVERARWGGFTPLRRQSERPRVGWAGGIGHTGDLEMIASVVKALADQVDWVFMGMCPDEMRPWVKEFHPGVALAQFPAKLASLNLDLAIAPLELNPFNEAKSHLRLLEYGILGYPVVCSDVYPYRGDCPVMRVRNRHQDWVDAILDQVSDLDECARNGDRLRAHVESHWILEDNLDMWMQAWLP